MDTRSASLAALVLALGAAHCGSVVVATDREGGAPGDASADAAAARDAAPDVAPSPTCAEVRASCGPAPQRFVRGHAEGLAGLDGSRVLFAMRYLREFGDGLNVPHGVASAWGRVAGGAVEACVCLPRGGNEYPEVAAVAFAPGAAGDTGRDVTRAMYSQRYATLGDEDLALGLAATPTDVEIEAALAATVERASAVTLRGLDVADGARAYGGLVADERPVAAQVSGDAVAGGRVRFEWIMPGRQWPSERLAYVVDRNENRRCDDGDVGALVPVDGRSEVAATAWLQGDALAPVCRALRLEAVRAR